MPKTIEDYCAQYANEPDRDLVARNLSIDGADGATVANVIKRLRNGDARDYPGYRALYLALHQANPNLAHEFSLRFSEVSVLVARGDRPETALDALFRYYTQELALPANERSAGIPPESARAEISL